MAFADEKHLLLSKSVWGGIISLLPVLDKVLVATGVIPVPFINDAYGIIAGTFGPLLGIYGRVVATKKIS